MRNINTRKNDGQVDYRQTNICFLLPFNQCYLWLQIMTEKSICSNISSNINHYSCSNDITYIIESLHFRNLIQLLSFWAALLSAIRANASQDNSFHNWLLVSMTESVFGQSLLAAVLRFGNCHVISGSLNLTLRMALLCVLLIREGLCMKRNVTDAFFHGTYVW